jgi:hypothetical protein
MSTDWQTWTAIGVVLAAAAWTSRRFVAVRQRNCHCGSSCTAGGAAPPKDILPLEALASTQRDSGRPASAAPQIRPSTDEARRR